MPETPNEEAPTSGSEPAAASALEKETTATTTGENAGETETRETAEAVVATAATESKGEKASYEVAAAAAVPVLSNNRRGALELAMDVKAEAESKVTEPQSKTAEFATGATDIGGNDGTSTAATTSVAGLESEREMKETEEVAKEANAELEKDEVMKERAEESTHVRRVSASLSTQVEDKITAHRIRYSKSSMDAAMGGNLLTELHKRDDSIDAAFTPMPFADGAHSRVASFSAKGAVLGEAELEAAVDRAVKTHITQVLTALRRLEEHQAAVVLASFAAQAARIKGEIEDFCILSLMILVNNLRLNYNIITNQINFKNHITTSFNLKSGILYTIFIIWQCINHVQCQNCRSHKTYYHAPIYERLFFNLLNYPCDLISNSGSNFIHPLPIGPHSIPLTP